jgi:predicted nucleic-acid-binding Zn-ribbon protein
MNGTMLLINNKNKNIFSVRNKNYHFVLCSLLTDSGYCDVYQATHLSAVLGRRVRTIKELPNTQHNNTAHSDTETFPFV